jgi:hypothetical protein
MARTVIVAMPPRRTRENQAWSVHAFPGSK